MGVAFARLNPMWPHERKEGGDFEQRFGHHRQARRLGAGYRLLVVCTKCPGGRTRTEAYPTPLFWKVQDVKEMLAREWQLQCKADALQLFLRSVGRTCARYDCQFVGPKWSVGALGPQPRLPIFVVVVQPPSKAAARRHARVSWRS
jgi:hypothetical protein